MRTRKCSEGADPTLLLVYISRRHSKKGSRSIGPIGKRTRGTNFFNQNLYFYIGEVWNLKKWRDECATQARNCRREERICGPNGLGDYLVRGYGGLHQLHVPLLAFAPPRLAHSLPSLCCSALLSCSVPFLSPPVDVSGGIKITPARLIILTDLPQGGSIHQSLGKKFWVAFGWRSFCQELQHLLLNLFHLFVFRRRRWIVMHEKAGRQKSDVCLGSSNSKRLVTYFSPLRVTWKC